MPIPLQPRMVLSLVSIAVVAAACRAAPTATSTPTPTPAPTEPPPTVVPIAAATALEQAIVEIPLAGDAAESDAEISSMTWYGDALILMPQYPGWDEPVSIADGRLFDIAKDDLVAFVDGSSVEAMTPVDVAFDAAGVDEQVAGFEGFEALAFSGDRAFLSIEGQTDDGRMSSYLVAGNMAPDLSALELDPASLTEVPLPVSLDNMSTEALLVVDGMVLAIFEANGANVNPEPLVHVFDLDLSPQESMPFPSIEYRVTDASAVDEAGRLWVSNFFWPGEAELLVPAPDGFVAAHGEGPTHALNVAVERLLELQFDDRGLKLTATPPIQLQLVDDDNTRNWEGLVRLGDRGFLLVTDKFPATMLAFVPLP